MKSAANLRQSKLVLGVLLVSLEAMQGCSTTLPGASTTPLAVDESAAASAPAPFEVVPIRGTFFEAGGAVRGRLLSFRSPIPVSGAAAELYVAAFPTEEFDAEVTNVVRLDEGWYAADVRLLVADARLAADTSFEGRLVARPIEKIACRGEATP